MYAFQFMLCTYVIITNDGGRNAIMNIIKYGIYSFYVRTI